MRLAYSKFKSTPLYLEWAPENTFKTAFDVTQKKPQTNKQEQTKHSKEKEQEIVDKNDKEETSESEDDEPEDDTTLYIKNISFDTTDEMLKKVSRIDYVKLHMQY